MLARLLEDSPRGRLRVLALVALLAVALRLAYVAEVHDHPYWRTPLVDAADYHGRALQVARGAGLGPEVYYKAPAYPYLVGQVYRVCGPRLEVVYALQMLGGVLAAALVAALGWRWYGPLAGLAAGLLAGLYVPLAYFENQLLIESSALFFSVLAAFLICGGIGRRAATPAIWADLLGGLAAGLALQLRPVNVALVAALLAAVLLPPASWSLRLRRIACLLLPVLVLLVPTLRHNRVASGRLVPISVNGGINFYIGNNPDYDTTVAIRPGLRWEELTQRFDSMDDPVRWQRNFYRASFEWMRAEPGSAAALACKKLVLFWNRREVDRNQDSSAMLGSSWVLQRLAVPWSVLAPLGLLGLLRRRRDARRLPLHALVLLQILGVVAFFVTSRYRLAVVPWLGVAAGTAVESAVAAVRLRDARTLAGLAAGLALALLAVLPDWYGVGSRDFGRPDFEMAEVLARRGDRDGALRAYERAAARHGDDPDVRFRYGEQLERFGRRDSAQAEYGVAMRLAPWSYKPALALGGLRLETGDLDGAWAALAEAERRGDPHGRTLYDMGLVRERQGRYPEALDLFRRSLALPDEGREVLQRRLGIARTLLFLHRPELAEIEFRAAAGVAEDPVQVPVERGVAWLRTGDAERALDALRGIEALDRSARAQLLRARALLALGRIEEARAAGLRAQQLDPGLPGIQSTLARSGTQAASGLDSIAPRGASRPAP